MPWKETCYMDERLKFIARYLEREVSFARLCRQFAVSRKTGYKWVERYAAQGPEGLRDQSRAPHSHPNAVAPEVEAAIVALRRRKMTRGPLKLLAQLRAERPELALPCASTAAQMLKRHGLAVNRRRRRVRATPTERPLAHALIPNDVWCADFKGWFRCGNGMRCDPLTISDACSRYLLRCQVLTDGTGFAQVRPLFEAAFREHGLPRAIRTDNGPPFATTGLGGLSRLAAWWIRLGIRPERIEPGKLQQNGRHERLHRTLKSETLRPPRQTPAAQQRAFDAFRRDYNAARPHQALGQQPPARFYYNSARPYPERLPTIAYPDGWERRQVRKNGHIKWGGKELCVCRALAGEGVGLQPVGEGRWRVYFDCYLLGEFDERRWRINRPQPAPRPQAR